ARAGRAGTRLPEVRPSSICPFAIAPPDPHIRRRDSIRASPPRPYSDSRWPDVSAFRAGLLVRQCPDVESVRQAKAAAAVALGPAPESRVAFRRRKFAQSSGHSSVPRQPERAHFWRLEHPLRFQIAGIFRRDAGPALQTPRPSTETGAGFPAAPSRCAGHGSAVRDRALQTRSAALARRAAALRQKQFPAT